MHFKFAEILSLFLHLSGAISSLETVVDANPNSCRRLIPERDIVVFSQHGQCPSTVFSRRKRVKIFQRFRPPLQMTIFRSIDANKISSQCGRLQAIHEIGQLYSQRSVISVCFLSSKSKILIVLFSEKVTRRRKRAFIWASSTLPLWPVSSFLNHDHF